MGDMTRELRLKTPATVVHPDDAYWTAGRLSRHQMVAGARRAEAQGRLRIMGRPHWDETWQEWRLPVRVLRHRTPWYRSRWFIASAAFSVLGLLFAIGWWVLTSLAAFPLALLCAGAFAGLALLVRIGRRPSVRVTQIVEVRR